MKATKVNIQIDREGTDIILLDVQSKRNQSRKDSSKKANRKIDADTLHRQHQSAFGLTSKDTVLSAIPISDNRWLDLVEDCVLSGARLIVPGVKCDAAVFAKTIVQKNVTVAAAMPELWAQIYRALNSDYDHLNRIRSLVFTDAPNPESRDYLILRALSKELKLEIHDVFMAYWETLASKTL